MLLMGSESFRCAVAAHAWAAMSFGRRMGTAVDRGTSSADVLCDMWRDVEYESEAAQASRGDL